MNIKNQNNLSYFLSLILLSSFLSKSVVSSNVDTLLKKNIDLNFSDNQKSSNHLAPKNLYSTLIDQLFFQIELEKLNYIKNEESKLYLQLIDLFIPLLRDISSNKYYKTNVKNLNQEYVFSKKLSFLSVDEILKELTFSGTSGIRGKAELLEEVSNYLALATKDLALKQNVKTLIIGYDTRHSSPLIAHSISNVLSSFGLNILLIDKPIPSPMISYYISFFNRHEKDKSKVAGIMITGSHNPSGDNGFCLRIASGAVMIQNSEYIFERFKYYYTNDLNLKYRGFYKKQVKSNEISILENPYENILNSTINNNKILNAVLLYQKSLYKELGIDIDYSKLNVLYDSMNGVGAYVLPNILKNLGFNFSQIDKYGNQVSEKEFSPVILVSDRKPYPNRERVNYWKYYLSKYNCDILLSNDGDGDRFALADLDFIDWNELFVLLIDYFGKIGVYEKYNFTHIVATHTTTYALDKIAKHYGLKVERVPVGFKNISKKIENIEGIKGNKVFAGFEGNGGMVLRFDEYIQDKDGMVANTFFAMLKAESIARGQASLKEMINMTYKAHKMDPDFGYMQELVLLTDSEIDGIIEEINSNTKHFLGREIDISKSVIIDEKKGIKKITFTDESWFIIRTSGTEKGKARVYVEGPSQLKRNALMLDLLEYYSNKFVDLEYYEAQAEHIKQWLLQDYSSSIVWKLIDLFKQKKWSELKEFLLNSSNLKKEFTANSMIQNDIELSSLNGMWIKELLGDVGIENKEIIEAFVELGISIPDNRMEIISLLKFDIIHYNDFILLIKKLSSLLNKSKFINNYKLYHLTFEELFIRKTSLFFINFYNSHFDVKFPSSKISSKSA